MGQNPSDKQPHRKPDPWGRNLKKPEGPPDLDVLLGLLRAKLLKVFAHKKNIGSSSGLSVNAGLPARGFFIALVMSVVVIIWVLSGIFIVAPAERAVITRFGKYVETVGSGPHWIPRFIQARQIVNVQRVSMYAYEAEMLTKDENIVSVAVAVQYRVNDAKEFLFNGVDPIRSLEQATASALRQVVGHNGLDNLLTTGRSQVREQVAAQLQVLLGSYKIGLVATDVTLQSIKPPEAVTADFDDAIKAREDQQAYVNTAGAYAKKTLAAVQGQTARILQEAEAYKKEVVLEAQAATAGYLALLPEYKLAPQIMRQRLYLSTMESIFSRTTKVFLDQKNSNPLLYLPLDKLTASPTLENMTPASPLLSAVASGGNPVSGTVDSDALSILMGRPSYPTKEDNK